MWKKSFSRERQYDRSRYGISFFLPFLSSVGADRSTIISWNTTFHETLHAELSRCHGYNKSWYLQLATGSHFNKAKKKNKINFHNPAWLVLSRDEPPLLSEQTDNVIRLMKNTGGLAMEIFGLTFWDLMDLDIPTYNKIKKTLYDIAEERAKEQEAREKADQEKAEIEERRRRQEEQNRRNR